MPEHDDEGSQIPDHDYWERLGDFAKGKGSWPSPQSPAKKRPPPPIDETDPLALIVAALQDNTDAANRAAHHSESVRKALGPISAGSSRNDQQILSELGSLIVAVQNQTATAEVMLKADETKYFWGGMGITLGILLGLLIGIYVIPSLRQLI
jgi:hypothetical protein